jgi:hypothetical protein
VRLSLVVAAVATALTGACANNVSDEHAAPVLVSTKPAAQAAPAPTTSQSLFTASTPAAPQSVITNAPVDASAQKAATVKMSSDLGLPPEPLTHTATVDDADLFAAASKANTKSVPPLTGKPLPPARPSVDISKQTAPQMTFLRIARTSDRLLFNESSKEFTFRVKQGGLQDNIQALLDLTISGQLQYKVSVNHSFPNDFEIHGKTAAHLIDQMVGPFKQPAQAMQDIYINNVVLIHYTKGVSTNEK